MTATWDALQLLHVSSLPPLLPLSSGHQLPVLRTSGQAERGPHSEEGVCQQPLE